MRQALALLGCAALLAGCESVTGGVERFYDSKLPLDRPVDWWHQLQGGPVANQRPPPPGVTDPYPNFAAIPAKPTPIDPAARRSLLARMTAQRDQATRLAAQDPVAWPVPGVPSNPASPAAPAKAATPAAPAASPTPPAPDPDVSTMTLEAASAPAAAPAPPPKTPLDPDPPRAFLQPFQPAAAVASGPVPALPTAAPPLPRLAGLPTSDPVPVVARGVPSAAIRFAPGSAALPEGAEAALRTLVARRAGAVVGVRAGGDARSAAPEAQRAALPLALRRTGAITAALIAAGVPSASIRAEATAQGRDASARLLD